MKKVYFDNAGTTPVDPRALETMLPYFSEKFGNTFSIHDIGREAAQALEESRNVIAEMINAEPKEIIFTGSATESNNLALKGIAFANRNKGNHIIISSIEHSCVLESANWLKDQGFEITMLPVDQYGMINTRDLESAVKEETVLVSIIHANNEIGTIQPLKEIGGICKKKGIYFHTDATQSFGKESLDVADMDIDLLTAGSHKIYGPKGAACLFVRAGVVIEPIMHGGGQEFGMRSGTTNLASIVGFAEAAKICKEEMTEERKRLSRLRDRLIGNILKSVEGSRLNGHSEKRLFNNVNLRFPSVEGEALVLGLNSFGISGSGGSACSSGKPNPSRVLLAIGLTSEEALSSIRLTLGRWSTEEDIEYVSKALPKVIEKIKR